MLIFIERKKSSHSFRTIPLKRKNKRTKQIVFPKKKRLRLLFKNKNKAKHQI